MNKRLLESKMKLYGDTSASLAEHIGVSIQTFTAKKNERHGAEFKASEIEKIKTRYNLTETELVSIFFT